MLTADEVAALTPEALNLAKAITNAFGKDSPGGKRITKREMRRIGLAALALAWKLLRDVAD